MSRLTASVLPSPSKADGGAFTPVPGGVEAVGRLLFTDYLFPFEVTSILIIVAMVGSVVLARRES